MDQLRRAPQHAVPGGPLTEGTAAIMERSIISGDNVQFGRLRPRVRVSESEKQSCGAEDERTSTFTEARVSHGQSRGVEGARNPTSEGSPAFQSRPTHRRYSRGRSRTSSESEKKGKGSKEPVRRKRVFSETEPRPRWDNTNMSGLQCLTAEKIWFDKRCYDEAERRFYEGVNGPSKQHQQDSDASALLQDIAKSRQNIRESLDGVKAALQQAKGHHQKRRHRNSSSAAAGEQEMISCMKSLELENQTLHKVVGEMRAALQKLESRVAVLEKSPAPAAVPSAKAAPVQAAPVKQANGDEEEEEEEDDVDLFGSDDEDDEAARLKQERLDAYAAKKAKKPALIAKSSILLDVKPWDDETDMAKLEESVRSVQMDGLLWGASKLVPVGYGIKKLQINCVVEDDKVGTDILEEEITKFEDFVQSVDVAAFNKI